MTHSSPVFLLALSLSLTHRRRRLLLVVLPHPVLTVEVERVDGRRGAEQVVELGLDGRLQRSEDKHRKGHVIQADRVTRLQFPHRQHGDVGVHQLVRLHHVLRLRRRGLGGDHHHGADVLRQSRRTQEVWGVLQEAHSAVLASFCQERLVERHLKAKHATER